MNLTFDCRTAQDLGQFKHPQMVMQLLGISYKSVEIYTIADIWVFNDCDSVPAQLPDFLRVQDQK